MQTKNVKCQPFLHEGGLPENALKVFNMINLQKKTVVVHLNFNDF